MDQNTAIKRILQTGKVEFGTNRAKANLLKGKIKVIIVSNDCPKEIKSSIESYSNISGIPLVKYRGSALELGEACGKPFVIANLSVIDLGDINISDILETQNLKVKP
jgi:large subunit ribosomal protein L30e